jgi:lipopolysaccharide export system permease protein
MPLLAIPLAVTNPRLGRSFQLLLGLLAYVLVTNLLALSHAWIAQGRLSFVVGVWLVPGLVLGIAAILVWGRQSLMRSPIDWVWLQIRRLRSS